MKNKVQFAEENKELYRQMHKCAENKYKKACKKFKACFTGAGYLDT